MVKAGDVFHSLTVVRVFKTTKNANGVKKAECLCACGKKKVAKTPDLVRGAVRSCGCLRIKAMTGVGRRTDSQILTDTRKALDAAMTDNTGLKNAIRDMMDQADDKIVSDLGHRALQTNFHAEREARARCQKI